jgi:hypothetical protein
MPQWQSNQPLGTLIHLLPKGSQTGPIGGEWQTFTRSRLVHELNHLAAGGKGSVD